jgi:hypothetical protein
MTGHESGARELVKGVGLFAGHAVALVVGLVLMVVGVGLGVGLVTLPVAIPVGLAGLCMFLWGLFGGSEEPVKLPPGGIPDNPPQGPVAPKPN